jgi:peptide/nickel transport system permease protein
VRQDYIRTARAKGLSERTVIMKHALRNSMLPVITLLGLYLPFLFSGAVLIEVIFAWPGMGRIMVDAIFQRDYPLVMATSFIFAVIVIAGNLIADVLYAVADPRIRYD